MANKLNMDLTGKVIIVASEYLAPGRPNLPEEQRRFLCKEGFGCRAFTLGYAIFGTWLDDGSEDRIEGYMVEKLAESQPSQ